MSDSFSKVESDRALLREAQSQGKTLRAYVRLSGPGWLQSAITLGGGSLAGALFLGVLGGTSLLWLQLVAITFGLIMLSAITYVTLSSGRRPFEAINNEINPALGWGWLVATSLANMIWCMPQFSLSYDALDRNLFSLGDLGGLGDTVATKWNVTAVLFVAAAGLVLLSAKRGLTARLFDLVLKLLIGLIVVCFVGVVIVLVRDGQVELREVLAGLIPRPSQWNEPAGKLGELARQVSPAASQFWSEQIVSNQRSVMIAAAATAVGINMTFLMPYSMLNRGWDKQFRGFAVFDLATGMAVPYLLVTSCVVIASATSFHAKIDEQLSSQDLSVMQQSPMYESVIPSLVERVESMQEPGTELTEQQTLQQAAELPTDEKILALALVKRDAFQLSETLVPLLGPTWSNLVFGLGVFAMGFSTIVILMLINGFVFREMFNLPDANGPFAVGAIIAGLSGASWVFVWSGGAKFWLPIIASSFGAMLLPIAYITFFLMMNSKRILGDQKPTGIRMWIWNILMIVAVAGAVVAAEAAIVEQMGKSPEAARLIIIAIVVYVILIAIGFVYRASRGRGSKFEPPSAS